ncbi:MAG: hypothetical protein CMP20_15385 [Rickettsiales bacterium]|nr:hypothetical protein [Rickettsiales bacterium]
MASFCLEGGQSITTGFSLEEPPPTSSNVQEMDIGASLPVLLLPGGQGTQEQQPTRIRTTGLGLSTRRREIGRSNRARVDGVDEVSTSLKTLYELYRTMSGAYKKRSKHYFFMLNDPDQPSEVRSMDTNDSILEQVRSYGTLNERNASFVAQLEQIESQTATASLRSDIEKMSRNQVLQGLKDGSVELDPSAEFAFYQAAASTRAQFVTKFPEKMTYPTADEKWILAMGRTSSTRVPFVKIALSFYHEIAGADPSISMSGPSIDANLGLVAGAASELITDPVKQQVLENLSVVTGAIIRSERPRFDPDEFF